MQSDDFYSVAGRINSASVEYGNSSFLRAVDTDANEDISGKDIASHSNKVADSCED